MAGLVRGPVQQLRRATKVAETLPATTTDNIFTVNGGRVLVYAFVGQVTTVNSATATNLKVTSVPSVGTLADVASNLAIASLEAGTIYVVEGDGTALIGVNAGFAPATNAQPFVLPAGTIRIETSATNTGASKWDVWYIPLDDGARINPAA